VPPTAPGPGPQRADLVRLVDAHRPADPVEAESQRRILEELERLEDPTSESADPVHLTASALVVGRRGVVLHRHKVLGRWLQPGGHIEAGEWPGAAARREAEEETGLPVAQPDGGPVLLQVDVHPGPRGHTHLDLRYLLLGPDREPAPPPGESPEVRWCTLAEARALTDGGLAAAFDRAAALRPDLLAAPAGGRRG
jgi:8-oxo-dGTP pyrophosphatase MutT (NUDIX family)